MSGHTPGPWRAETSADGAYEIEAENPSYVVVCSRRQWPHRAKESNANARLIAAAPTMLAALQAIEAHHIEQNRLKGRDVRRSKTLALAQEAIAKALFP